MKSIFKGMKRIFLSIGSSILAAISIVIFIILLIIVGTFVGLYNTIRAIVEYGIITFRLLIRDYADRDTKIVHDVGKIYLTNLTVIVFKLVDSMINYSENEEEELS